MSPRLPRRCLVPICAALLLAGCTRSAAVPSLSEVRDDLGRDRVEEGARKLERLVARYPGRVDSRELLMHAYFELAMEARQESRLREYTDYLEQAYEQGFAILALEPKTVSVHLMMGLVAAYQGQVERALTSFDNCRRLEPDDPQHHLNVAESLIYLGRVGSARHYLAHARRQGMAPAHVEIVELLAAWRQDDTVEVEELFDIAYTLDPEIVRAWNDPDEPIESFEDLKLHCCTLPFCGPYMGKRCPPGVLKAALPTLDAETKRRLLVLEMLRRRRLEEIYRERKDLEIEVEPPEEIPAE